MQPVEPRHFLQLQLLQAVFNDRLQVAKIILFLRTFRKALYVPCGNSEHRTPENSTRHPSCDAPTRKNGIQLCVDPSKSLRRNNNLRSVDLSAMNSVRTVVFLRVVLQGVAPERRRTQVGGGGRRGGNSDAIRTTQRTHARRIVSTFNLPCLSRQNDEKFLRSAAGTPETLEPVLIDTEKNYGRRRTCAN